MNKQFWQEQVDKKKEDLIQTAVEFLQIASIKDETTVTSDMPFGSKVNEALQYLLSKGKEDHFLTKNVDGYAGHIEMGEGEESLGILCHVDVVPTGAGWTSSPFSAEIRDEKLYARGAIDDKGPTIAAYFAMKIVQELGLPFEKRVRMILGTDEESDWKCVNYYFQKEEMPTIGIVPDADFPIINSEKGIADLFVEKTFNNNEVGNETNRLLSFHSGERFNMVPEMAMATIQCMDEIDSIEALLRQVSERKGFKSNLKQKGNELHIQVDGKSAHAMEPKNGIHAGDQLLVLLDEIQLDSQATNFIHFMNEFFTDDNRGNKLRIQHENAELGDVTVNVGKIDYNEKGNLQLYVNIRYPATASFQTIEESMKELCELNNCTYSIRQHLGPHYLEKEHPLIQTLIKVYEEQTGEKAELLAIGGGTYARSLKAGVAFGPMFPGREDVAHQKDEYISIKDLLDATAIYAQAIYELAIKK